jgi:hypothetical protein
MNIVSFSVAPAVYARSPRPWYVRAVTVTACAADEPYRYGKVEL